VIVIDASLVAGVLLGESGVEDAMDQVAGEARGGLVAPDLIAIEVASAVISSRRSAPRQRGESKATKVAGSLAALPSDEVWGELMRRFALIDLYLEPMSGGTRFKRAFEIAELARVSIYDAVYLSLASELRAPIATLDSGMAGAARAMGVRTVPSGAIR
jgi:predicted nucleic acid-binding protein